MKKIREQLYFLKRFALITKAVIALKEIAALFSKALRALFIKSFALISKDLFRYSQRYKEKNRMDRRRNELEFLNRLTRRARANSGKTGMSFRNNTRAREGF